MTWQHVLAKSSFKGASSNIGRCFVENMTVGWFVFHFLLCDFSKLVASDLNVGECWWRDPRRLQTIRCLSELFCSRNSQGMAIPVGKSNHPSLKSLNLKGIAALKHFCETQKMLAEFRATASPRMELALC